MKRTFTTMACIGALFVAACGGESQLPNPTGEGDIRAINAIPDSPAIAFLIEERSLGSMSYKQATTPISFDDFDYNFNFQFFLPGDDDATRVATQAHKVEAGRDHIFVLTGDPMSPTVTVWNSDLREWSEGQTVFEMRFAHLVESRNLEAIDFYVDEVVDPQVVANRVATVSYGEISTVQDIEEGEYVVTITAANDVDNVLFTSPANLFAAQTSQVAAAFDGNANDTSSLIVNIMSQQGAQRRLSDINSQPALRFVHASYALPTVDIYDDDMLTNRIVSGLAHGEASAEQTVSGDVEEYFWTPENSTATILLQGGYLALPGTRNIVSVIGATDEWVYFSYLPDLAPVSLYAKMQILQSSLDNDFVDVYLKPADETIVEEDFPTVGGLFTPELTAPIGLLAGSYDLYVTPLGEKTEIAGPLRIDAANGDVFQIVILDTADPAFADVRLVAAP